MFILDFYVGKSLSAFFKLCCLKICTIEVSIFNTSEIMVE